MKRYLIRLFVCLLGLHLSTPALTAQMTDGDMISPEMAGRCGLQRVWFTQVQVAPARGRIIDLQLYVSSQQSLTVFEVTVPEGPPQVFSERDRDAFGDQIGVEAAQQRAADHAKELTNAGIAAEVKQRIIPETTLYATTDHGVLQAFDARTGALQWTAAIGQTRYPTTPPAIAENYVAISNGSDLYLLDATNGHAIWTRRSESIPLATGSFAENTLYVPMLNGQINAFEVQPEAPKWPQVYFTRGAVRYSPSVIGRNIVWASDVGDISVAAAGVSGLRLRLVLPNPSAGKIATKPPQTLFAAGLKGSIYSLDLADGSINWELSTGYEMDRGPIYVDQSLFMPTKRQGMYSLNAETGEILWRAGNVTDFAAKGNGKVFVVNDYHQLVVLDAARGFQQASTQMGSSDLALVNSKTDWIFLATRQGLVYCLRPQGSRWPTFYEQKSAPAESHTDKQSEPADSEQPATESEPSEQKPIDPFTGDTDPFGAAPAAQPAAAPAAENPPATQPPANDDSDNDPFN